MIGMSTCQRCGDETNTTIMSKFNTDTICSYCKSLEKAHPQYQEADRAEIEQCRQGNYNFEGIGLPSDLKKISIDARLKRKAESIDHS